MAKSVTTIPATLSRFTAAPINSTKKRRVAAYARVSTDNEEQLTSYEAQIDYYTNYIKAGMIGSSSGYILTKASPAPIPKSVSSSGRWLQMPLTARST